MRTIFRLIFSLLALCVYAQGQATYCVRAGATGSNNGSDWNNAFSSLPASLQRGATYFIADGTYGGYTFDDVENGAAVITIKKATANSHGTETGWTSGYGDGQTVFNGDLIMQRDYYVIDGQTRNENQWNDDASYGFRAKSLYAQNSTFPPGGDHITIQYASLGGNYSETYYSGMGEAVYCGGFGGSFHNWKISRCFMHNSTHTIVQFAGVYDMLVEYCFIGPGWGKEAIRGQINCYNVVIRHNVFYNASQRDPEDATSGITAEIAIWSGSNLNNNEIYGNTFYNNKSGGRNGVVIVGGNGTSWVGPGASGTKVYNNTFAGVSERAVFGEILLNGSNNEAKNNLFYNCGGSGVSASSTANNLTATSDPFVNYSGRDFRITSNSQARNAGANLGTAYNTDGYGVIRGNDGQWDVGAFEFSSGGAVAPSIVTQPSNVTVAAGQVAEFSVAANGSQPLSFQWQRNGTNISGATSASYSTPPTIAADNGATFRVVVSNSAGSVTSAAATLTVNTSPGNVPPTASITSPVPNATFTAPANITINASAADSDGTVAKVEFFNGTIKLGEVTASPFSYAWGSVAAGTYSLTVKAFDNAGATTASSPVSITVNGSPGNVAPSASITSPVAGASFTAPANISINASAADSDGTVAKVEFFNGATKLGEVTTSPFTFTWANVAAGSYSLTAKAFDNLGASTTSSSVSVSVSSTPPPGSIAVGDRVMVNSDPSLRVRSAPQLAATVLGNAVYHEMGTVVAGPVSADGFVFFQVNYDSTVDGWSIQGDPAAPWLIRATTSAPKAPTGVRIISN
jgi:hypothetical protein